MVLSLSPTPLKSVEMSLGGDLTKKREANPFQVIFTSR